MKPAVRIAGFALVSVLMAGCSTDALRFQDGFYTGADGVTTGSVPTPRADVASGQMAGGQMAGGQVAAVPAGGYPQAGAASQPYPADSGSRYALAPVSSGSASPSSVQRSTLAPAGGAMPQASTQPMPVAPAQDPVTTATTPAAQAAGRPAGWSTDGAPRVSLQPGETISSLSRRYGVPASEIMRANGITDATRVTPGQQLVIPGYSRGGTAAPAPAQVAGAPAAATDPALAQRSLNEQAQLLTQAPATAAAGQGGSYTVQSGDTLSKISRQTGVPVATLRQANGLSSDSIRIGQTLSLGGAAAPATTQVAAAPQAVPTTDPQSTGAVQATPVQTAAVTQPAEARPAGYQAPQAANGSIAQEVGNDVASVAPQSTGIGKLRWPVRGQVVTPFGAQDGSVRNDGIDISVPEGTDVKAAENGVVIYAGSGLKEYGNTVLVRHDNGLVTVYGHASELKVNRGDKVERGQVIAASGMTGNAKQPKLHFEVRDNATPSNPTSYLE